MLMTNITILVGLFLFCFCFFETVKDINVLFLIAFIVHRAYICHLFSPHSLLPLLFPSPPTVCYSLLPKYGVALPLAIFQLYNPLNFPVNFP